MLSDGLCVLDRLLWVYCRTGELADLMETLLLLFNHPTLSTIPQAGPVIEISLFVCAVSKVLFKTFYLSFPSYKWSGFV